MDITTEQHEAIATRLRTLTLVHGLGDEAANTACTIAAINLELAGQLTDTDSWACMWAPLPRFVIHIQDAMPVEMMAPGDEHGDRWRAIIPFIAGSANLPNRAARLQLILDWMWDRMADPVVIATIPGAALPAWRAMLSQRTAYAASAAASAATATDAADAASAAAYAAGAAHAASAAAYAAGAAGAAYAAAYAAGAAYVASAADAANYWRRANPAQLLTAILAPLYAGEAQEVN